MKWCNVLKRIINVILILREGGLAISGSSHLIRDLNNGNFLGLIELPSRWDPILQEYTLNVKDTRKKVNAYKFIIYVQSSKTNLFQRVLAL